MKKNNSKLVQFVKGSAILVISNIILKATNFLLLPLYTGYLTPDQLGISDSITSLISFVFPLLVLAFDSAFGAFYYDNEEEEYQKKVFNTTFFFLFAMSILTTLVMLGSSYISSFLFHSTKYNISICVAMFSVAVNMWFLPLALQVRMQNKLTLFSIINLVSSFFMILLNIVFVTKLEWGYFSLIASILVVNLMQLILYLIFAKVKISIKLFDKALFKKMLRYALPMVPMVLAEWILSLSDRYILLYFAGEYEVGIYGVAARFLSLITVITNGVYVAYTSFAFSSAKDSNAKQQFIKVLDVVFIILSLLSFTMSIFGKEIISVMADEKYFKAYALIGPLLLGQICYSVNTIMGYGFAHAKKSAYFLVPTLAGTVLNVILNFMFIPKYGSYAAALTTMIGYFVMMIITYFLSQRVYECGYHFGRIVFSLTIMAVAVIWFIDFSLWFKALSFVVILIVIAVCFRSAISDIFKMLKKLLKKSDNVSE